ncbi:MAG: hypothetical protein JXQ67_00540 [Campylobacterales bacterium]|nr:hypothetical protein [Campylobacterales bacterium]
MKSSVVKSSLTALSLALMLTLGACSGGSGDSGSTSTATSYSGVGLDGIIVGATVCVDVNRNNLCDVGEPSAITDANGTFEIPATTETGPLVLIGGTDLSTNAPFTGTLKAPAGSKVVSPLTSAVQALVESGQSATDAQANVKTAMGLGDVDVDLTSFDPYNSVSDTNLTVAENAKKVLAQQTKLQVLVHTISSAVAGADANNSISNTMSTTFAKIATSFSSATAPVTLDETVVKTAIENVAAEVYAENEVAKVSAQAVATTTASVAVVAADRAEETITNADVTEATNALDDAISSVNDEIQTQITNDVTAVVTVVQTAADNNESLEAAAISLEENLTIQTDLGLITQYVNQTWADANATRVIANVYTDAEANATTAETAYSAALAIQTEVNAASDLNSTFTAEKRLAVKVEANIAAAALSDAVAIKQLNLLRERVALVVEDINSTKSEIQTLFDVNASTLKSNIETDMEALSIIANAGYDVSTQVSSAQSAAAVALGIYNDANNSLQIIIGVYADALTAQAVDNEIAVNAAKAISDTEAAKYVSYLSNAQIQATIVNGLLVEAQGIKLAFDEAAAEAATRIAQMQAIVIETAAIANTTLAEATVQKSDAESTLAEIEAIAAQYSAASSIATDAQNIATQLVTHYTTLQGYVSTINDANSSMVIAVANQDESAAIDANNSAATAALAIDALGTIVNPLFAELDSLYTQALDVATQNAGTTEFIANDVSGVFYSEEFVRITFVPQSVGASVGNVSFLSLVNAQDQNFTTTYSIENGKLLVAQADGNVTTLSLLDTSTSDMMIIRNDDDNTTERVYTSEVAFLAALVTFDGTDYQVDDAINDSTGLGDGKEINTLNVRVDSTQNTLVIELQNAGDIATELASEAPIGYSNIVWIGINNYLEFGLMSDGNGGLMPYLNKDIYTDGEFTNGTPETNYSYSLDTSLLTLTVPLELLNTQEYLLVKAEVGIDENNEFNSTIEVQDDYTYDSVIFNGIWNPFPDLNTTTPSDANLTAIIAGQTLYGIQVHETEPDGDGNVSNDGQPYGTSMSFDNCTIATDPVCSGYSGGTDEWGPYGIDASLTDHTYEIIGEMLRVTEDGNEGQGISEIVPTGNSDAYNGIEVNVTFKSLDGNITGTATFFVYTIAQDRDDALAAMGSSSGDMTTRTITAIGSWYNADLGINLVIFDDAHYFMAQDNNGSGGVAGGIEIGSFTLDETNTTLTITGELLVNSNEGDTAVGGVATYNDTNDTLTFSVDGFSFDFARDEGTNVLGAWTRNETDTSFEALILHSDNSYLSTMIDVNSSVAYDGVCDEGTCTYNMFERGSYTANLVDTNLTVSFTPYVDYNGIFGPPADTNISFDVIGYPIITNSDLNVTFEKVVQQP